MSEHAAWWAGQAGDAYHERNTGRVEFNAEFFRRVLPEQLRSGRSHGQIIKSVIELGCGTGENMMALAKVIRGVNLWGVEVNESAAERVSVGCVIRASLLDFKMPQAPSKFDMSMVKGVLIHIPPEDLPRAYQRLYQASSKYIFIAEYHNPTPVEVEYRGEKGRLFKRDFAAEFMAAHPVRVIDYGFSWKHDKKTQQDDLVWTLFKKVVR